MVHYLYGKMSTSRWLTSPDAEYHGVLLRQARGLYVCEPENVSPLLLSTVEKLNVEVAFTMQTRTTAAIFSCLSADQTEIVMPDGSQYQVVDSMEEMEKWASIKIKKFQYACLVRKEMMILVWRDDVSEILGHGEELEKIFLSTIWGQDPAELFRNPPPFQSSLSAVTSPLASTINLPISGKKTVRASTYVVNEFSDEEKAAWSKESLARPLHKTSSVFVGLAMVLIIVLLLGFCTSELLQESMIDGKWIRLALVLTTPIFGLFGLFFVVVIFSDIFQMIGPIASVQSNSRFYSAIKPDISRAYHEGFTPPHITIQMPVYKEGLESVIIPTVNSLKAAISHYELNGGTASIFINDDGLQILPKDEREARIDFYHDNNIGWVARPKHGENGFLRAGKFKKASNMNFALNISNKVEDTLTAMIDEKMQHDGTAELEENEEHAMYQQALETVLEKDGRAWAKGNIRVGEFILIIDSDTRVPVDCLLYGAAEMFFSPEVAIVQHSAGVMQVVGDYFENGITFFTNQIYSSIRFSIGQGEVAPFVGHNAFLRWAAVQSVGVPPKDENDYEKYWSENHVSEDFDIALRLQIAGNVVRLASYHGDGFKEGVSLTIYDELARWEKYAYGCNELVFNPMKSWLFKGPFTPLFRSLLWCKLQLSSKTTILGYIATYYAIASGLPLTLANYFIIGWYNGYVDKFYMESWRVFLGLVVVFSGVGNVALAVLRHRLGEKKFLSSLIENFTWMPLFAVFFGGLSFHLNLALLAHMFSINMEWGATAKEAENSNFFQEMPKIFKSFKWMYMCIIPLVGVMVFFGCFAPRGWEIQGFTATVPLAVNLASHILLPVSLSPVVPALHYANLTFQFVLNPSLMIFSY
jgi:hypothetical protein